MATLTFLDVIRVYPWFSSLSEDKWRTLCQALDKFDSNPSPEEIIAIAEQIGRPSKQVDYFFKAAVFGQSMTTTLDKLEKETSDAKMPMELDRYGQMRESTALWINGTPIQAFRLTPEEEAEYLKTRPIILPDSLPIQSGGPNAGAGHVHGPTSHLVPQPGGQGGQGGDSGGGPVHNRRGNNRPPQMARRGNNRPPQTARRGKSMN
ncbi:hypothetical protein BGZ82_000187 [Podila clonocystis]|nr:hypothetical protein BGZ82_000187 [Podila clonocystis]